jgi:hypothetical protein
MLLCFAAGWPFSIYKSYTSRVNGGKSLPFLVIVFVGYIAGMTHKVLYNFDGVIYLYILNGAMVLADIMLYRRNAKLN